ncbi:FUSC family protein, partial [Patulibacter sp. S7RM1-6]
SVAQAAWAARRTSARIGVSFVVPLLVAVLLGHPHEGAVATQGAFAAIYARDEPRRRRLRVMVTAGLTLVLVVSLGTVVGGSAVATVLGAGLVAGLAALVTIAWDVGRPREFIIVLSFLAATQYGGGLSAVPERAALVLAGAATVTAIAMAALMLRPRGPEEDAVRRFLVRLGQLLDAVGTDDAQAARHDVLFAAEQARTVLTRAGRSRRDRDRLMTIAVAGEAVLDGALGLVLRDAGPLDPGWARAVRRVEASLTAPEAAADVELPDEMPGTMHGPRFVRAMQRLTAVADPARSLQATLVPFGARRPHRRRVRVLRRALRRGSLVRATALRIGVGVAIGTAVGLLLDEQRGIWVGLTTSAVMQASNVTLTLERTVQRAAGTIVGVGVAAGVLALDPTVGVVVLALAVFQTLMQATLATAYGVATVFATPIALLIVDLGLPGTPAGSLVGARVVDTLLGGAVGLAARRLLWPRSAATQLGAAQGAVIEAARDVLHAALTRAEAPSSELVRRSRRTLHTALANLQAVHADAVGDLVLSSRTADERWPATAAVQRLAHAVMAFPATPDETPTARAQLPALDAALDALAHIAEGHRAPAWVPLPPLGGYPATERALARLRDVLAGEAEDAGRGTVGAGAPVPVS